MQKLILSFLFILTTSLWAQEASWITIYPVNNCSQLPMSYQLKKDGTYLVKLLNPYSNNDVVQAEKIEDLNDLSLFTDSIVEISEQVCTEDLINIGKSNIILIDGQYQCNNLEFFSEDYIQFVQFTADLVNKSASQCDNVIPLIKLQEQITQLNDKELLKFKASKKFGHMLLKIITGKETDQMINQFQACGGKNGSHKFIKNMIMLEAVASCIVPQMLTWEEADQIATQLGEEHKNLNLLSLNKKENKLTKKVVLAFTNKVLEKEVDGLVGPIIKDLNKRNEVHKILYTNKMSEFYLRNHDVNVPEFEFKSPKVPVDSKDFIQRLGSKRRLDNYKGKDEDLSDYVAYIFSVDASIEIGEGALPLFLESTFKDKLPSSWSEAKKKKFIDDKISTLAQKKYNECMQPRKEYSKYGHDFETKRFDIKKSKNQKNENALLKHRIDTKNKFCTAHPNQCPDDNQTQEDDGSCEGSINMLQMDDNATETEIVQGCVLQAVTISIEPLLEGIIYDQKHEFKDDFDLTDEMAKDFTKDTWKTLMSCANNEVKKLQNISKNVDITKDDTLLQKINTTDYENIMVKCSDLAESKVSARFVDQVIINEETIQKTFGDPAIVLKWEESDKTFKDRIDATRDPQKIEQIKMEWKKANKAFRDKLNEDENVLKIGSEVVNTSFKKCVEKQYYLSLNKYDHLNPQHGLEQKNTLLCTPIVEMNASFLVVENHLNDLIKEEKLEDNKEIKTILETYNKCENDVIKQGINDVGSLISKTPINTVKDSKSYLDDNLTFYNCVTNAISGISYVIAGTQFDDEVKDQKGQIKGISYFASLKPGVQEAVKECFDNGMKEQGNWTNFVKFNDKDGLDKLQDKCSLEANKYVIPKLLVNETHIEMKGLIDDGFIESSGQVGNVLFQSAVDLRKDYGITKRSDLDGGEKIDNYIASAYEIHLSTGGTTESFIEEMSSRIEAKAIQVVHKNLLNEIQNQTNNVNEKSKFSSLDDYFPASCLQDIYTKFMKDAPDTDEDSMSLKDLASYMQTGLSYYEKKDPAKFWDELKVLKSQCDNMDQFNTAKDFNKSQFYSIIIKGQLHQEFMESFKKSIDENVAKIKNDISNPNKNIKLKYATKLQKDIDKLFKDKLKVTQFDKMVFGDDEVLKFAQEHFDAIQNGDEKIKQQLTQLLLKKIYKDTSKGSFASEFARANIVASIGIDGVDDSVKDANDQGTWMKIGSWRFGPNNYAMQSTKEVFNNPSNIENTLNWNNLKESQRIKYIQAVSQASVIGTAYLEGDDVDKNGNEIKGSYEKRVLATKGSLKNMFYQQALAKNPTPQDTNPIPFQDMAKGDADMRFSAIMYSMKSAVDSKTKKNGYNNFNEYVDQQVEVQLLMLGLSDEKPKENKYTIINYNNVVKPHKSEVREMLKSEFRKYYTENVVIRGLEEYKYSNGESFTKKMENKVSNKTKGKLGNDILKYAPKANPYGGYIYMP